MATQLSIGILFDPPRLHRWEALEYVQGLLRSLLDASDACRVLLLTGAAIRHLFPHSKIRVLAFEHEISEAEFDRIRSLYGCLAWLKILPCQLDCPVAGDVHLLPDLHAERYPLEAPAHFSRDLEQALGAGSLLLTPDLETAWQLHHHPDWRGAEIMHVSGTPGPLASASSAPPPTPPSFLWYPVHAATPDPEPLLQVLAELNLPLVSSGDCQVEVESPWLQALGALEISQQQALLEKALAIWAPPPQSGYGVLAASAQRLGIPVFERAAELQECLQAKWEPQSGQHPSSQERLAHELFRRWGARDRTLRAPLQGEPLAWLLPPGHHPPESWREPQDLLFRRVPELPEGVKSVLLLGGQAPYPGRAPWVRFLADAREASGEFELERALERAQLVLERLDIVALYDALDLARALLLGLGRQPRPLEAVACPASDPLDARLFETARKRLRAITSQCFLQGLSRRFSI